MGLRIAFIGAGKFTNQYMYPQLSRHDIELVAICDLVEDKATLFSPLRPETSSTKQCRDDRDGRDGGEEGVGLSCRI